jgi:hypothetical protein
MMRHAQMRVTERWVTDRGCSSAEVNVLARDSPRVKAVQREEQGSGANEIAAVDVVLVIATPQASCPRAFNPGWVLGAVVGISKQQVACVARVVRDERYDFVAPSACDFDIGINEAQVRRRRALRACIACGSNRAGAGEHFDAVSSGDAWRGIRRTVVDQEDFPNVASLFFAE